MDNQITSICLPEAQSKQSSQIFFLKHESDPTYSSTNTVNLQLHRIAMSCEAYKDLHERVL